MALFDIRCKDVARFISTESRTLEEIGDMIHKLYPRLDPRGSWVRDNLVVWNPFLIEKGGKYGLSELGRALISLLGREGDEPTEVERVFLLGVMMIDENQRRVINKLLLGIDMSGEDGWIVDVTRGNLQKLCFL